MISESFKINLKIMKFLCWYPTEKKSSQCLNKVRGYVLYLILLVLLTSLTTVDIIVEKSYNNMQVIYVTETFSYCLKLLPFLINNKRIKKCIDYFDQSYFAPKDNIEEEITSKNIKLCQIICKIYIIGITCAETMFVIPSLFSKDYMLPLRIWLPYDVTSRGVVYYPTLFYFCIVSAYAGSATSLIDPLIGGLACHATGQLKILKHRLQNLHKSEETAEIKSKITYENVKKCIQYHNAILRFVQIYENCFSWVIFSQFLGTTLGLCFCCIAITMVPLASLDAAMYISFFMCIIWQVFFYCYFGTLLFEENNTLITAIYVTQWYEYDVETRKLLITLMERSKRPMIVTAEKFIDLTLETFSKMIKGSYSLIAVFN